MRRSVPRPGVHVAVIAASIVIGTAALHFAQAVIVPIAVAVLLAFVLAPPVAALERRWRVPTLPAVALVVTLAVSALAGLACVLALQLTSLAAELPHYRGNIMAKVVAIRGAYRGTPIEKVQRMAADVASEMRTVDGSHPEHPVPVTPQEPSMLWHLPTLLRALASAGFALVLLVFMLLRREDLRKRLIQMVGDVRLAVTTKALDEAGQRITRYLVRQSIINGSVGLAVWIGLFLIGVPYAAIWGVLAAILRFIPYLGAWVAAFAPTVVAFAVFPGWLQSILVVALIGGLELAVHLAVEPYFHGQAARISEIGVLVAIAFWTWLWGPIGLLLATPVTVCLLVVCKHAPGLQAVTTLIGEPPDVRPRALFYQRLVARDDPGSVRTAAEYLSTSSPAELFEDVLVPALAWVRFDHERGVLTEHDMCVALDTTQRIARGAAGRASPAPRGPGPARGPAVPRRPVVAACPSRDATDAAAVTLLDLLSTSSGYQVRPAACGLLVSQVLEFIERERPDLACVVALPPGGLAVARRLVKRLRHRFPDMPIVVGRWGSRRGIGLWRERLIAAGADEVGGTIQETSTHIVRLLAARGAPVAVDGDVVASMVRRSPQSVRER